MSYYEIENESSRWMDALRLVRPAFVILQLVLLAAALAA